MSHELRTPLNHIIGFTELVVDKNFGDLNEMQEEYLNDALKGSRHLLSLINDILDLSKVEAGKLQLQLSNVNIAMVLKHSLVVIKEKAMKHGIKIEVRIDDIVPEAVTVDERKFKQIIYNLLSNAVKFTPDGGKITLTATLIDENLLQISVIDTGIGLKDKDQERIFNVFEQIEASSNRKYQGTGLGLSITKQFVELHDGRIWAESEGEGQGSRFCFIVPVDQ
jgi:signal transduction histidine kinase